MFRETKPMSDLKSRREFAGASAAAGLLLLKPRTVFGYQANSSITVGVLGYGGRGTHVVNNCFARNEYARITEVCDLAQDRLDAASQKFSGVKTFTNYHDLLASDVDAIYIATPVYRHPEHFAAAVAVRKHIFMEKPAGADAAGCRKVMEAARKADPTKRISVDFQQRYGKDYRHAYEVVKSGELGRIVAIRAAWIGNGPAIKPGLTGAEERNKNWYFYKDLSGDMIVEQDCHNIDVVNWFMGTHPVIASGYGSRKVRMHGDVLDNLAVTFEFGDNTVFSYQATQVGGYRDVSETFICEKGSVNTSRQGIKIWRQGNPVPEEIPTKYDITLDAVNDFLDGARTGRLENAGVSAAESTLTAIMARESIYQKTPMTWDRILKS